MCESFLFWKKYSLEKGQRLQPWLHDVNQWHYRLMNISCNQKAFLKVIKPCTIISILCQSNNAMSRLLFLNVNTRPAIKQKGIINSISMADSRPKYPVIIMLMTPSRIIIWTRSGSLLDCTTKYTCIAWHLQFIDLQAVVVPATDHTGPLYTYTGHGGPPI